MKVTHVCPSIEREANGMSKAVLDMSTSLTGLGCEVEVHTTGGLPRRPLGSVGVHRYRSWNRPAPLRVSPALGRGLADAAQHTDLIHSHGLWTFPPAYAMRSARRAAVPSVVTAHGAFNPWPMAQSRLRKRLMWKLIHGRLMRRATCLHATAEAEASAYRRMGLRAPVAIIPLGIDVPETLPPRAPQTARKLLFLGRLHRKKGIDLLLQAWKNAQPQTADWQLHLVGPGDPAYVAELRELAEALGCRRVHFRGPIYGAEKTRELRSAEAFALTTYDENFGLAVAEALAHGLPALVTRGAPWSELPARRCGWWVDIDQRAVTSALLELTDHHRDELSRMGAAGRQWMLNDFSIDAMGRKLHRLYEWLLGGGSPPEFVRP